MNPSLIVPLIIAVAVLTNAQLNPAYGQVTPQTDVQQAAFEKVAYKTVQSKDGGSDSLELDVFYPPNHDGSSEPAPCVVFFFGGGWNSGRPGQFHKHCEYFASRGMLAISAEYRTRDSHGTKPADCVFDGKSAVRWIRDNASKLGVDPDRLVAGGGSAGGHVAAAVAACRDLEEPSTDPTTSCLPNALMLFNPVYDNGPHGYGHDRVKDHWRRISPRHNLHAEMPPTIAFFGTNDKLIPVATTQNFAAAMKAKGVRYDNHLYDGQPHGFFNYGRRQGDRDFFADTVDKADRFLISLGILDGQPTIEAFMRDQAATSESGKLQR